MPPRIFAVLFFVAFSTLATFADATAAAKTECKSSHTAAYNELVTSSYADLAITDAYNADQSCVYVPNDAIRSHWKSAGYELAGFDCDHILDMHNVPGIPDGCGRDIVANKIPAATSWNRGVGNLCWAAAEAEKRVVYGDEIVDNALVAVRICCGVGGSDTTTQIVVVIVVVLVVLSGVIVGIYFAWKKRRTGIDQSTFWV